MNNMCPKCGGVMELGFNQYTCYQCGKEPVYNEYNFDVGYNRDFKIGDRWCNIFKSGGTKYFRIATSITVDASTCNWFPLCPDELKIFLYTIKSPYKNHLLSGTQHALSGKHFDITIYNRDQLVIKGSTTSEQMEIIFSKKDAEKLVSLVKQVKKLFDSC